MTLSPQISARRAPRPAHRRRGGYALLYPSTRFHSVREVRSGERLAAVTWVQSHIRRADQREILVQLDRVRQQLGPDCDASARQSLDLSYANLFRMWAET